MKKHLYVGSYTTDTGAPGVYLFDFCSKTGQITFIASYNECKNPSFLASKNDMIYVASELTKSKLCSYKRNPVTGKLTYTGQELITDADLCHLYIPMDSQLIFGSNYTSGSLITCGIREDGSLDEIFDTKQYQGIGYDCTGRQEGPHIHSSGVDSYGKRLLVADLGLDLLLSYEIDFENRKLKPETCSLIHTPMGSGPRHFVFHPTLHRLYVVTELSNTLLVYDYQPDGKATLLQELSLLPEDYTCENYAADIHLSPDAKWLYVSNRGHDSLVSFEIDVITGLVTRNDFFPAHGAWPRNFCVTSDGRFVIIANQKSGNIVVCERDTVTGKLTGPISQAEVPQAVFVMVL